jgi:bacterioferritin-associated ferredoxin
MQVQFKVAPNVIVTAEGDQFTEVFDQLSRMQEVFGSANQCGKCKKTELRFVVRENKDSDKFYELRCQNPTCRAVLEFGCHKTPKGSLYPKIKGEPKEDGKPNYLPNNGWQIYNHQTKQKE